MRDLRAIQKLDTLPAILREAINYHHHRLSDKTILHLALAFHRGFFSAEQLRDQIHAALGQPIHLKAKAKGSKGRIKVQPKMQPKVQLRPPVPLKGRTL